MKKPEIDVKLVIWVSKEVGVYDGSLVVRKFPDRSEKRAGRAPVTSYATPAQARSESNEFHCEDTQLCPQGKLELWNLEGRSRALKRIIFKDGGEEWIPFFPQNPAVKKPRREKIATSHRKGETLFNPTEFVEGGR